MSPLALIFAAFWVLVYGQAAGPFKILKPSEEWTQVNFGQVGEPPFNYFKFKVGSMGGNHHDDGPMMALNQELNGGHNHDDYGHLGKCYLELTDAFCPGDRFEVSRLNETSLGGEILLRTPPVPFNPVVAQEICDRFPVQCLNSTDNPEVAYYDPTWSSGRVKLKAGNYKIVVKPTLSPYCSGGAFIRLRCTQPHPPAPRKICPTSLDGMHLIMEAAPGPAAGQVCRRTGMTLAELTNANFNPATSVAFACAGALSTVWIGAWNGQTWAGQEGLGLTVGSAAPGGSINVYNDGQARYVLCQE